MMIWQFPGRVTESRKFTKEEGQEWHYVALDSIGFVVGDILPDCHAACADGEVS